MERIKTKWKDESYLARLRAADQANECLYHILDIGQEMLQCGGEISRVEDSIRRLCLAFGAERADVFTITSNIQATIYSHRFGAVTQTRRVQGMRYDLQRLEQLNDLCRHICAEHLSLEEMSATVERIRAGRGYGFSLQILSYALVSASFSLFFGGSLRDAAVSGVIGVLLKCLDRMIRRTQANALLSGLGHSEEMISIGNIMLLIPGIALTNSLRDMFSGNTMSGLLRFLEAIIMAMVIAFGFALVAALV